MWNSIITAMLRFLTTEMKNSPSLIFPFSFLFSFIFFIVPIHGVGTILFNTVGRSLYGFDIFAASIQRSSFFSQTELRLTDGVSINYNGFFPCFSPSLYSHLNLTSSLSRINQMDAVIHVTERHGYSSIYLSLLPSLSSPQNRREVMELPIRVEFPVMSDGSPFVSMKDRPSLSGDRLIFISTHEPSGSPRQSWAAVYSTNLLTGATARLTPNGIADFSPSVSPSGRWTVVASSGVHGWSGEIDELHTDIYIFKTSDGSERALVIEHGGWPCWADESTIYFHRKRSDEWWSVYKALIKIERGSPVLASINRITPPGFHAFTPAASPNLLAVATRRPTSQFRHIELIDLRNESNACIEITRLITPHSHHYNPFFSPDAAKIGYHRCRGDNTGGDPPLLFQNLKSSSPEKFSLLRINGAFPSFSPDGKRIAYAKLPGLYIVDSDGSNHKKIYNGNAFATAWDWKRSGVIYTSRGPHFAEESSDVDIISINLNQGGDEAYSSIKKLTTGGQNNAFPSPSPDGKWVVFRSGRSGHKNLYIMDAIEGERNELYQLTNGPWTDTMCNWSPNGEWIAFASDREDPGSGSFSIFMVRSNGTGLKKVVQSGLGGRTNHPWFSPDSDSLVFTSDYAGVSAEPVSNPNHFQPYGEIFTVKIDGSEKIQRLTHDSFEDGTPTWTSSILKPRDVPQSLEGVSFCLFDDCHWLSSLSGGSNMCN